jgi:hypothetical protein
MVGVSFVFTPAFLLRHRKDFIEMTPKRELQIAFSLIIILFVVGVISYAAFPAKPPELPIRIMYNSVAGKALFDHKNHFSESGYAIACTQCHHHPPNPENLQDALLNCGYCHQTLAKGQKWPKSCLDCHDKADLEDSKIVNKSDAFHAQCIRCHKEVGSGPEDCNSCHVL